MGIPFTSKKEFCKSYMIKLGKQVTSSPPPKNTEPNTNSNNENYLGNSNVFNQLKITKK